MPDARRGARAEAAPQVNLQAVFEQSTYGHIVICLALMAAGFSVMSSDPDSLGPSDLFVIFQMLNEIEVTAKTVNA